VACTQGVPAGGEQRTPASPVCRGLVATEDDRDLVFQDSHLDPGRLRLPFAIPSPSERSNVHPSRFAAQDDECDVLAHVAREDGAETEWTPGDLELHAERLRAAGFFENLRVANGLQVHVG